ncbi:glutaredoxin domain-containing cysteine-rich protein [Acrasis kona]|uniref:Glutaredoxin domain-containing cysteine-rich protein n=1 Tax=Acrasis kona TaxID=1008807 RepID=A0AAW2YUM5_9EUKA
MSQVTVYLSSIASVRKTYNECKWVTDTLDKHRIKYEVVDLGITPEKRADMEKGSGKKTVPQLFVGEKFIGGYEELEDLNENEVLKQTLIDAGYQE